MENTHENYAQDPMNDGAHQGHDWTRHPHQAPMPQSMKPDPDDEEEETELPDWGDIDPQDDPSRPPGPMDPSGPGSAV